METPKIAVEEYDWKPLLEAFETYATITLKMLAPRELSGDPNHGVTEVGFKLVLFGFFATRTELFDVESEREVESGRIDVFVRHRATKALLVLELKYVRVGFLEKARANITQTTSHTVIHQQYRRVNEELLGLEWRELKKVTKNDFYCGAKTTTCIDQLVLDAVSQASRYTDLLTRGEIRRLANPPAVIHYAVAIGIGSRVHCTEVYKMHSLLCTENKKKKKGE